MKESWKKLNDDKVIVTLEEDKAAKPDSHVPIGIPDRPSETNSTKRCRCTLSKIVLIASMAFLLALSSYALWKIGVIENERNIIIIAQHFSIEANSTASNEVQNKEDELSDPAKIVKKELENVLPTSNDEKTGDPNMDMLETMERMIRNLDSMQTLPTKTLMDVFRNLDVNEPQDNDSAPRNPRNATSDIEYLLIYEPVDSEQ